MAKVDSVSLTVREEFEQYVCYAVYVSVSEVTPEQRRVRIAPGISVSCEPLCAVLPKDLPPAWR